MGINTIKSQMNGDSHKATTVNTESDQSQFCLDKTVPLSPWNTSEKTTSQHDHLHSNDFDPVVCCNLRLSGLGSTHTQQAEVI